MKPLILLASLVAWIVHLALSATGLLFITVLDHVTAPAIDFLREEWDKTKPNRRMHG